MPSNSIKRLDDEAVAKLPFAKTGAYVVRDAMLTRHAVRVSKRHRTFFVQAERPARYQQSKDDRKTFVVRLGRHPMTTVAQARAKAIAVLGRVDDGLEPHEATTPTIRHTTLGVAYDDFMAAMRRDECAPKTIKEHARWYKAHLADWEDKTLLALNEMRKDVRDRHNDITKKNGPVAANHVMRLLRAIYRHAASSDTKLSVENHCCLGVAWNPEKRRDLAIPFEQMPAWWRQVNALRAKSPIRAGFHALTVLTGQRPGELRRARWEHLDVKRRVLILPKTKTNITITIPLSVSIVRELRALRDAGRQLYPGSPFIFAADSAAGHITHHLEKKTVLSHCGNSGRHSYKTICAAIGIDELTSRLLLGHALSGVSQGYVTRVALEGSSLPVAQRRVSRRVVELWGGR